MKNDPLWIVNLKHQGNVIDSLNRLFANSTELTDEVFATRRAVIVAAHYQNDIRKVS